MAAATAHRSRFHRVQGDSQYSWRWQALIVESKVSRRGTPGGVECDGPCMNMHSMSAADLNGTILEELPVLALGCCLQTHRLHVIYAYMSCGEDYFR